MNVVFACALFLLVNQSDSNPPPVSSPETTHTVVDSMDNALAKEFDALAQKWLRAYNANDSTTLAGMYTVDASYISSHVAGLVAQGRDRLIANFQNGIRHGGHIDAISILSIQSSCDLATLLCKYEATNSGQKATGRNLLIVKKIRGAWQIVLHMTVV